MKYSYRINHDDENEAWIPFEHFSELEKYFIEMKNSDTPYTLYAANEISPKRIIVVEGAKNVILKGLFKKVKYDCYVLSLFIGTNHSTDELQVLELKDGFETFYQSFESIVENTESIDFSRWQNESELLLEEDRGITPMALEF